MQGIYSLLVWLSVTYSLVVVVAADDVLDGVILPFPNNDTNTNISEVTKITTGFGPNAYLLISNQPFSVVAPTPIPSSQQSLLAWHSTKRQSRDCQTTLRQARQNHCTVGAANGGPFNRDGTSSGPLVLRSQHFYNQTDPPWVGFGTTMDGEWVLGRYGQWNSARRRRLWDFVTGFGWLVYNGTVVANNTDNPTGADRAPRTAVGLDWNSNLMILVADGCEKWYEDYIYCASV